MTAEERIKQTIGELVVRAIVAETLRDEAVKKLEEAKPRKSAKRRISTPSLAQ